MHSYEIVAYDKDNDMYVSLGKDRSLQHAIERCENMVPMLQQDELRNPYCDNEPFDWLEVVDENDWLHSHWVSYEP